MLLHGFPFIAQPMQRKKSFLNCRAERQGGRRGALKTSPFVLLTDPRGDQLCLSHGCEKHPLLVTCRLIEGKWEELNTPTTQQRIKYHKLQEVWIVVVHSKSYKMMIHIRVHRYVLPYYILYYMYTVYIHSLPGQFYILSTLYFLCSLLYVRTESLTGSYYSFRIAPRQEQYSVWLYSNTSTTILCIGI